MHGFVCSQLAKYVMEKDDRDTWNRLLKEAGIGPRIYIASYSYPDEEIIGIISVASKIKEVSVPDILEDFGEFIVKDLTKIYNALLDPNWKTLDVLENTNEHINRVRKSMIKRGGNADMTHPEFKCSRPSPEELIMIYSSPRKMCALAKGLARGFAKHYNEHIQITETSCMLKGSPACTISVKLVK